MLWADIWYLEGVFGAQREILKKEWNAVSFAEPQKHLPWEWIQEFILIVEFSGNNFFIKFPLR